MIRLLCPAAAAAALILAAGVIIADCPAPARVVRTYQAPTYYAPPAVKVVKKVVVEEVPVVVRFDAVIPLVSLPSYSAVYAPPLAPAPAPAAPAPAPPVVVPQAQQAQPSPDVARVLAALELISKRLDRLEGGGKQGPPPPVVVPQKQEQQAPPAKDDRQASALQIVQAKCASCHNEKTAADKGAGLVLSVEGKLAELSGRQANKVIGRSYQGTMPPKDSGVAALTDQEVSAIVQQFAGGK